MSVELASKPTQNTVIDDAALAQVCLDARTYKPAGRKNQPR